MLSHLLFLVDFVEFIKQKRRISISYSELFKVAKARKLFEEMMKKQKIYGVNTDVGAFLDRKIDNSDVDTFQKNLIVSHSCGVGASFPEFITRGAFFLLINTLKKGCSGVSPETLNFLIDSYNNEMLPDIPEVGSLGASGDLIPLSHLIFYSIEKHRFCFKKGEAFFLINGTHFSTSDMAFSVYEAQKLMRAADLAVSMDIIALDGNSKNFETGILFAKLHNGQRISGENIAAYLSKCRVFPHNCSVLFLKEE